MNQLNESSFESLRDVEEVIKKANDGQPVKLSSGVISKRHGALRDASRLQALASLARNSEEKTLLVQNSTNYDAILNELCNYAPGLTSMRLNKSVQIGSKQVSRRVALIQALDKMIASDTQRYDQIIKGRCIDLSCFSGADRQFLSPLFTKKDRLSVKNSSLMKSTMVAIFKQINKVEFNDLDADLIDAFGIFGCELFKNTQEHACFDENGNPYIAHVEGMIASWSDLTSDMHEHDFSGHPKLMQYWKNNIATSNDNSKESLRCMQVSFFDTGPGLVGRAFGNNSNTSSEKKLLLQCIAKHFTTKDESGAGNGYPAILTQLSKVGGLIRIRSGNQCLFNCFDKSHHGYWESIQELAERNAVKEQYLMDFHSWDESNLSQASGAVVSIIVPLRKESGQHILL
jgi:hypothetical protein